MRKVLVASITVLMLVLAVANAALASEIGPIVRTTSTSYKAQK